MKYTYAYYMKPTCMLHTLCKAARLDKMAGWVINVVINLDSSGTIG